MRGTIRKALPFARREGWGIRRQPMEENRKFVATPKQWREFIEVLNRPARLKPELARLFSERQEQDFTTKDAEDTD